MRYLLCLIPPVAMILNSKNPLVWILSAVPFTIPFYPIGVLWAIMVTNSKKADKRTRRLERAMRDGRYHGR